MITAKDVVANAKSLLEKINKETGKEHANLSEGVETLALGYGVDKTEVFDGNIELEGEFEPGEPEITDYYEEGYNNGYSKGLEAGGGEGSFEEGKKVAYEEIQDLNAELEQTLYGTDTGGKSFYDEFWDSCQNYGNRKDYSHAFGGIGWTNRTLKPKYDIKPTSAYMIFRQCGYKGDLVELFNELGITFDLSNATNTAYMFAVAEGITHIGVIDVRKSTTNTIMDCAFQNCSSLVTIDKIYITKGKTGEFNDASFINCKALENLTIEGEIFSNGLNLQHSTKLSKASWINIVGCYSTTISGLSMTGSLASVNSAFETSEGANDGSTSAEWLNLIATRPNVSFNLV